MSSSPVLLNFKAASALGRSVWVDMPQPSERDALLGNGLTSSARSRASQTPLNGRDGSTERVALAQGIKARPGPLDISKRNRYAILAGVWTATFLSVSA